MHKVVLPAHWQLLTSRGCALKSHLLGRVPSVSDKLLKILRGRWARQERRREGFRDGVSSHELMIANVIKSGSLGRITYQYARDEVLCSIANNHILREGIRNLPDTVVSSLHI